MNVTKDRRSAMHASAQTRRKTVCINGMGSGGMMVGYAAGWMGGGYGGIWVPILLVIIVAGLVAWIVAQKRK